MIILHEVAEILLSIADVSALQIKTLSNNKILTRAPRATVPYNNVKCKQSKNHAQSKGETQGKLISSPSKRKEMMEYWYLKSQKGEIVRRKI